MWEHVFPRCTLRSAHCLLLPTGAVGVPFLPHCLDEVPKHPEERRWRVERSLSHRWPGAFPPLGLGEPRLCRVTDHPRRLHMRPTRTMWVNAFIHNVWAKLCDEHQVLPRWTSPGRKLLSVTLFPCRWTTVRVMQCVCRPVLGDAALFTAYFGYERSCWIVLGVLQKSNTDIVLYT